MSKFKRYERYKDSGVEWLGEIPEHWEVKKIKYLANVINVKASDSDNNKTYIGLENIESKTGKLLVDDIDEQQVIEGTSNVFEKNDVLFSKLRPYLAKCLIADFSGRCTSELLVLRCKGILPKYMFFFMLSPKFIDVVNSSTYGTKMPRANWDFIGNLKIPLPSQEEQKSIIEYLSKKCNEIDALIEDKEKLIELLQEKRQTIITEAVTKGLNPNVSMKDSGIEWIGEIPEHWKVTKVKYYYDVCLGKMIQPNQEDYSDTLEYYLCAINVTWDGIDISNLKEMWFSNEDKKKYSIKSGDLIVCEGGDVGRASIWDGRVENCYIQNAVHRVREKKNSLNKYLYYWLYFLKHAGYIDLICNKATIMHYTYEKFLNTILVIPHLGEQQEIINYLDEKIEEINSLKKEIEQQIQKLKEYRQSLISEAVTGKIDVRDYVVSN